MYGQYHGGGAQYGRPMGGVSFGGRPMGGMYSPQGQPPATMGQPMTAQPYEPSWSQGQVRNASIPFGQPRPATGGLDQANAAQQPGGRPTWMGAGPAQLDPSIASWASAFGRGIASGAPMGTGTAMAPGAGNPAGVPSIGEYQSLGAIAPSHQTANPWRDDQLRAAYASQVGSPEEIRQAIDTATNGGGIDRVQDMAFAANRILRQGPPQAPPDIRSTMPGAVNGILPQGLPNNLGQARKMRNIWDDLRQGGGVGRDPGPYIY